MRRLGLGYSASSHCTAVAPTSPLTWAVLLREQDPGVLHVHVHCTCTAQYYEYAMYSTCTMPCSYISFSPSRSLPLSLSLSLPLSPSPPVSCQPSCSIVVQSATLSSSVDALFWRSSRRTAPAAVTAVGVPRLSLHWGPQRWWDREGGQLSVV